MWGFLGFKKKQGDDNNNANADGDDATIKYNGPVYPSGKKIENCGRVYTQATKEDCYMFRNMVDNCDGFTLRYDKNDVLVWDKRIPGESMALIKVFGVIEGCPSWKMWDILHDSDFRSEWDDAKLEAGKIQQLNKNSDVGYYAAKITKPVANRDFVNQRTWFNAGNGEYVIWNTAVTHRDMPAQKGFVRALTKVTGYLLRPYGSGDSAGCTLTYMSLSEPKGWIPNALINMITTKIGPSVVDKLRKAGKMYDSFVLRQTALGKYDRASWDLEPVAWGLPVTHTTPDYFNRRKEDPSMASPVALPEVTDSEEELSSPFSPKNDDQASPHEQQQQQAEAKDSAQGKE